MKLEDIRNLDFNNMGGWPAGAKVGFCVLLAVLIGLGGWWFLIKDEQARLETTQQREPALKREFEQKQAKVANLDAYREQLAEMCQILLEMMRQLPSKTEMPELIADISATAIASGIDNELFEPRPEILKDFYAEQPIQLRMAGTYHQFGAFVSGVATLPRVVILTMHDIQLRPRAGEAAGAAAAPGTLMLEGTIKTYRYLEEGERGDECEAILKQRRERMAGG
jgi:type IV pilus assembly protein PilO